MNDFDPGEGWREASPNDATAGTEHVVYSDGERDHYWVREEPVPPLPTEPGWYVAFESLDNGGPVVVELLASPAGQWVDASDRQYLDPDFNIRPLGPLTRLEPRAVTAKAVLGLVREYLGMADDSGFRDIAREFGVEP